jgi:SAM-dependent methyltransferase
MTSPLELRASFRRLASRAFEAAAEENFANIARLLEHSLVDPLFLDLGCDDGSVTVRLAEMIRTTKIHGFEIAEEPARAAAARGVDVVTGDLNRKFPYTASLFDVVCSNQVIEHLSDTENFLRELYRITKPGGYVIVSTENLASWHNIASLVLGWQPFSLSNVSHSSPGLGNPLAVHRAQEGGRGKSWEHMRVFAYRGLRELFTVHGFIVEALLGAGYFPFPPETGRLDPRHAAFLTIKARRPG